MGLAERIRMQLFGTPHHQEAGTPVEKKGER